jgi:hypothetical protein
MNPFEHSLRDAQWDVPPLVAWTPLPEHKHAGLILKKFANLIDT